MACRERSGKTPGLPGGKPGAAAAPKLFVGDTLFAGSIGRTDLPGGNYEVLMRAITEVLFAFPDESIVYSGHGPETTIGRERRTNPFVLDVRVPRILRGVPGICSMRTIASTSGLR